MEFEGDPNNLNGDILNSAKEDLELFYEEKVKGASMLRKVRSIFLIYKKEITSKNICEN